MTKIKNIKVPKNHKFKVQKLRKPQNPNFGCSENPKQNCGRSTNPKVQTLELRPLSLGRRGLSTSKTLIVCVGEFCILFCCVFVVLFLFFFGGGLLLLLFSFGDWPLPSLYIYQKSPKYKFRKSKKSKFGMVHKSPKTNFGGGLISVLST